MSGFSASEVKALANLLKDGGSSSSEDDLPGAGASKLGPGSVRAPVRCKVRGNANGSPSSDRITTDPDDIWDVNEVDSVNDDIISDPRHRPLVNITYRQKVGSQDVFLQVTQKTAMTSSCETMILTLLMSGENRASIYCNVTEMALDIRSPMYRLHLALPHQVIPETATAEWNSDTSQLAVSLQLHRELDGVNF